MDLRDEIIECVKLWQDDHPDGGFYNAPDVADRILAILWEQSMNGIVVLPNATKPEDSIQVHPSKDG